MSTPEEALLAQIRTVSRAGVDWIQIREKDLEAKPLFHLADSALSAAATSPADSRTRVLLNDRLDVVLAAHSNGIHLGENSLPVGDVLRATRHILPSEFLIGVSCHSLGAARKAAEQGANYIFFGPVFATPSKARFGVPQGIAKLAEVCRAVAIPVLAIGGIAPENALSCIDAGAAGIAAIRLFQQPHSMEGLLSTLGRHLS